MLSARHIAIVFLWRAAKARLEITKIQELKLRAKLESLCFANAKIGVNRLAVNETTDLRLTKRQNIIYKHNSDVLTNLFCRLSAEDQPILHNLIKQEWTFDKEAYKALREDLRKLIDDSGLIEIKDGTPSLDLIHKKAEA